MGYIKESYICQGIHLLCLLICFRRLSSTAQIFNASHMAPWDSPHVTHDMILRFMGVNFSAILDGTAKIPSSIGSVKKPMHIVQVEAEPTIAPPPGKTPEQDKAMWEGMLRAIYLYVSGLICLHTCSIL